MASQQNDIPVKIPLYPYQERWLRDGARFKIAVKATQIGYSFAASLEAVLDAIARRTLWIVLSRGERQSLEFMQKVREHAQALKIAAGALETTFFENTQLLQHEVKFPNGSRIIGLPANPDTARGYTGNMILDEFAFHQQDKAIWAAAFGRISRGDLKLRVISTPNGQRGKYFELAKEVGLVDQPQRTQGIAGEKEIRNLSPRSSAPSALNSPWSGHWCDVHMAVSQGCPININQLREAIGDEETWQQEYECVFASDSENYIPLELIVSCESSDAWKTPPEGWQPTGECYWGFDVGRRRDLSVLALIEKLGDVFWVRKLLELPKTKFSVQEKAIADHVPLALRGAIDAGGLGEDLSERLAEKFPGRVEPVRFTAAIKQDLAVRLKKLFEERQIRIPDLRELRQDLNAVKRMTTEAGNVRFDAERTEHGHSDRFWALALALHAADRGVPAAGGWAPAEVRDFGLGRFNSDRDRPSFWDEDREEVGLEILA